MIKYTLKNNCQAQLLTPINATDTTLVLQTGQGGRMPTAFPFLLALEKIVSGVTTFREIIKVTNRTGDILTIVRSAGTCLPNDSSNTPGTTAFAFASGDYVTLAVFSEIIEDLHNGINSLDNTKQNNCTLNTITSNTTFTGSEKNGGAYSVNTTSGNITITINPALFDLSNGLYEFSFCKSTNDINTVIIDAGSGKTIDGSQTLTLTNYNEVATLVIATSTFIKIKSQKGNTINTSITGLTEDTTGDITADYFIKNNGTGNNTKIKLTKYMASDSEALAGTNQNKYINPKQLHDNLSNCIQSGIGKGTGTNYLADTNGIVSGYGYASGLSLQASCYTGSTSPASNLIQKSGGASGGYSAFCFPVKKGDYYRVDFNTSPTASQVSFTPLL